MAKSLDGIKKLNPDDIKKYRKMVLDYIGEEDSAEVNEQKDPNKGVASSKKVDGINVNKISKVGRQEKISLKELSARGGRLSGLSGERAGVFGGRKETSAEIRSKEDDRLREAIKRQEEERKKVKEEERQYQMQKEQAEAARKWEEKIKLEELEKEENLRIKENLRLEKIKREAEIKRIKWEVEMTKQAAWQKKKIKRQKAWKRFKRNFSLKLNLFYSVVKRNIIYIISLATLGLAIVYVVFCLLVLRFKIDNNLISQAIRYLPMPAVVTNQGVISYNDFQKIESKNYLSLNLSEKKNYLVKWLILRDLKKKYGLSTNSSADDLATKYVLDKDFNRSGISRINKINELLNGSSGIEQLGKYADEYNGGAYYSLAGAVEKFGPAVLELAIGQTSNIILRANGYYIIKRIDDKDNQFGVKYLFIGAETLDQYVSKKLGKAVVFILVN